MKLSQSGQWAVGPHPGVPGRHFGWTVRLGHPGGLAADAHHAVGVTAVVVHAVLHQLLLVQVSGAAVRAGEGGPVGDSTGEGGVSSGWARYCPPSCSPALPTPTQACSALPSMNPGWPAGRRLS